MQRLFSLLGLLLLPPWLLADPLPERANPLASYQISVRLDPQAKLLEGTERLTWQNPSSDAVGDLWFHLYLNAFKNTESTFFKESGGQLRGSRSTGERWGWIQVNSMRVVGGDDITGAMVFVHPDDHNAEDQTVARVKLPAPVPPGGSVALDIAFTAQLPEVFARTGYKRDYFLVAQWFPKLGVYEPAGLRGRKSGGWNCHQFHANSEFYADYGRYHVEITLPAKFILGATGQRTGRSSNPDGTVTYTHIQDNVHDFAWTASPRFVELKRTFGGGKDVTAGEYRQAAALLGRTVDEVRLSDVEITLLMQPEHMPQAERLMGAAMAGIKHYGLWYGRYPYRTLTVVDPAPGASGSGGMEYPTFITAGTSFALNRWPFDRIRLPEMVTIHEFGHQFWYLLVGNNEFEEAWLDEGINSYSTGRVMGAAYGKGVEWGNFLGLRLGEIEMVRMTNHPDAKFNAILSPAWKYSPRGAYGFNSYMKPEMALQTLENHLGEQTMARAMRTFHERWRFRHPSSEDFFAVANEVSGRDLSWYFDQVIRGTGILDYEIGSVSSSRARARRGVFDKGGGRHTITPADADRLEKEAERKGVPAQFESVVVARRRGEVVFPVEIELKFEGLAPERRQWDGRDRTLTYRTTGPRKLEWARIDPDRKIPLDVDWLNNARRIESDGRVAAKLAAGVVFWMQLLIALIGM